MADVFISYKRDERRKADGIARRLRALGLQVWLDAHIASGRSFDSEIEAELRGAKAVLVLWTPSSVASEWVRNEASVAKERGTLVALMLAPCELPIEFRAVQFEPLFERGFGEDHPSWVKVVERIKDLVGKRDEIESETRRRIFRQKRNGVLLWVLGWPIGAALLAILAGAATATSGPTPQFGNFYADSWDRGYAAASGTWELEGEELAAPVNHVEISCYREEGYCLEARAELFSRGNFVSVATDRRPIVSWNSEVITTRNEAGCGAYSMSISRQSESVTALEVNSTDGALCELVDQRKEFRLVDGGRRQLDGISARFDGQQRIALFLIALWSGFVGWRIFRIIKRRRLTWV